MQSRRSRTDMPRASPFNVRSYMEMTLLTVVYAGLQTAFGYRRRIRYLLVCPKTPPARGLSNHRERQKDNTSGAPPPRGLVPARYYLERQTGPSPTRPPRLAVLA